MYGLEQGLAFRMTESQSET